MDSQLIVYALNRRRPKSPSRRHWRRRAGRPGPGSRTRIRSIGTHTPRSRSFPGGFRRWVSPRRRSIGRCTSPRLRDVRRRSRSARFPNRRRCCKQARHGQAEAGVATLPNARGRTTADSPPRNGGGGRFRFMPKAFSRRSDGGTKPRRKFTARRANISRSSVSSPGRRSTPSPRPRIRSRSNRPCARVGPTS